jgi:hypothetical protein
VLRAGVLFIADDYGSSGGHLPGPSRGSASILKSRINPGSFFDISN